MKFPDHFSDHAGGNVRPAVNRRLKNGYRSLPFPFEEIEAPAFRLVQKWGVDRLAAYMGTWSGSQRYRKETGRDPIDEVRDELTAAWGDSYNVRMVGWDLHLRVGRVSR
jgi:hypothetical protein